MHDGRIGFVISMADLPTIALETRSCYKHLHGKSDTDASH
jgi:hypothetical protein